MHEDPPPPPPDWIDASWWSDLYGELRAVAGGLVGDERSGLTLSPTDLLHEAYMRLQGEHSGAAEWNDRRHFRRTVARVMRHVLVDHARAISSDKRGGRFTRIPLLHLTGFSDVPPEAASLLELDEAMVRFREQDERAALVVELRVFGGYSIARTAEAIGVSHATVETDWKFARSWLRRELLED